MQKHLLTKQEWKHRSVNVFFKICIVTAMINQWVSFINTVFLHQMPYILSILVFLQNHWFTYNETMTVESITQAVSNLALQFGEEDADPGAMV